MPRWDRAWVRSAALAFTLVLFALPMVAVDACGCVDGRCAQQPTAEAVREQEQAATDEERAAARQDATLKVAASGFDMTWGRASVAATSRDTRLGSSAELREQADTWFADIDPAYGAIAIPLLGLAGAALIFVRGSSVAMWRIIAGLLGAMVTVIVVNVFGDRIEDDLLAFGRDVNIVWNGTPRAHAEPATLVLYAMFLLPLAHEIVAKVVDLVRRLTGRNRTADGAP